SRSNGPTARSEFLVNPGRPTPQSAGATHGSTLRDPLTNGSGKAGLGATSDEGRNAGATCRTFALGWRMHGSNRRSQALEQHKVPKRHSHLNTIRHARPIRISKQLVAHVPA